MAVFKCIMCGGTLQVEPGMKSCVCEHCGSEQNLPDTENGQLLMKLNQANAMRLRNEFTKAQLKYEMILESYPDQSEVYWGICLCKYGIDFVDDPKTGRKVPTCHRTCFQSIFEDENYKNALKYSADDDTRKRYENIAQQIEKIQKDILEVAKKEDPYDIFICYKETNDDTGERTIDSVIAHDLYNELSEDYKVFFSRITLKGKIGVEFEPYIFSALYSAKIMLVVGTSYEHLHGVWVKNEWNRFLDFKRDDSEKLLIPCFKDMDPQYLPKEFAGSQAIDLGKVGANKILKDNISRVIKKSVKKPEIIVTESAPAVASDDSKIKRAIINFEEGNVDVARRLAAEICKQHSSDSSTDYRISYLKFLLESNYDVSNLDGFVKDYEDALEFHTKSMMRAEDSGEALAWVKEQDKKIRSAVIAYSEEEFPDISTDVCMHTADIIANLDSDKEAVNDYKKFVDTALIEAEEIIQDGKVEDTAKAESLLDKINKYVAKTSFYADELKSVFVKRIQAGKDEISRIRKLDREKKVADANVYVTEKLQTVIANLEKYNVKDSSQIYEYLKSYAEKQEATEELKLLFEEAETKITDFVLKEIDKALKSDVLNDVSAVCKFTSSFEKSFLEYEVIEPSKQTIKILDGISTLEAYRSKLSDKSRSLSAYDKCMTEKRYADAVDLVEKNPDYFDEASKTKCAAMLSRVIKSFKIKKIITLIMILVLTGIAAFLYITRIDLEGEDYLKNDSLFISWFIIPALFSVASCIIGAIRNNMHYKVVHCGERYKKLVPLSTLFNISALAPVSGMIKSIIQCVTAKMDAFQAIVPILIIGATSFGIGFASYLVIAFLGESKRK